MGIARSHRSRRRGAQGFALIEVLGATILLTTGLMAAFFMVGLGTSVTTDSKHMAQAYQAAQQEIEILRNIPWGPNGGFGGLGTLVRAPYTTPDSAKCYESRFLRSNGDPDASRPGDTGYPGLVPALAKLPNGRGGLIVTNPASGTYKNVSVVIRWTDPGNKERVIAVATSIAKGGIDPR